MATVMEDNSPRMFHQRRIAALQKALSLGFLDNTAAALMMVDLDHLCHNIKQLTQDAGFPSSTLHTVAVKANPVGRVLRVFKDKGMGAEVASIGELQQALLLGFPPERIVFDSPAKTVPELRFALSCGVHMNLDNFQEVQRVADLLNGSSSIRLDNGTCTLSATAEPMPSSRYIGLRVNPQVGSGSVAALSTAATFSKFGVPLTEARQRIISTFLAHPWMNALHLHVGSQGCPVDLIVQGVQRVHALLLEINAAAGWQQVRMLDIGGGLPVDYSSDPEDSEVVGMAAPTLNDTPAGCDGSHMQRTHRLVTPHLPPAQCTHVLGVPTHCSQQQLHVEGCSVQAGQMLRETAGGGQRGTDLHAHCQHLHSAAAAAAAAAARPGRITKFAELASKLRQLLPDLFVPGSPLQLVTENGRSLLAKSAYAASRVEYTKSSGGRTMAVVHFGADLLLRTCYLPGTWPMRLWVCDASGKAKEGGCKEAVQDVMGPLCFQGDCIAAGRSLPLMEPGDIVVVPDVGAYTLSMYSKYNSRCSPPLLGFRMSVAGGVDVEVLRRGDTVEEVLHFWNKL